LYFSSIIQSASDIDLIQLCVALRELIASDAPSRLICQSNSRIYIFNIFFYILSPSLGIIASNLSNLSPEWCSQGVNRLLL